MRVGAQCMNRAHCFLVACCSLGKQRKAYVGDGDERIYGLRANTVVQRQPWRPADAFAAHGSLRLSSSIGQSGSPWSISRVRHRD